MQAVIAMVIAMVIAFVLTSIFGGLVYVDHLQRRVDVLVTERDDALADKHAVERAIVVLADEAASVEVRHVLVSSGREAAISAPETDNGVVAPVLERAFRAADEIGGIQ